jgi:hypothetical protein
MRLMSLLLRLVRGVRLVSLVVRVGLVGLVGLLARVCLGMCLVGLVVLRRVRLMTLMRCMGGMMLVLRMGEYGLVRNRLVHAAREEHRRRVGLGLHLLLPRRRGALSGNIIQGVQGTGRPRRAVWKTAVEGRGIREEMLRVALGMLLRRVGSGLVGRRAVRSGRLLVGLARVRRRKPGTSPEAVRLLGEGQARVAGRARRPQSRHDAGRRRRRQWRRRRRRGHDAAGGGKVVGCGVAAGVE